jgi:metallo-beta-lactamase class B
MTGISARVACVMALAVTALGLASAQQPPAGSAPPDSPAVVQQIAGVKATVGPRWQDAVRFWCEAPRANRPDDPAIEPTRIFDNVYAIGSIGTVAYVIRTSAGLMMIDALSADEVESRLLPGFARLGLDPSSLRLILVAHGHADHFGGAAYFQERYGTRVLVSGADAQPATRNGELKDKAPVTLGDVTVTPIAVPGHTPGSMAFIFPVVDRGTRHVAALFGGSWLTPGFLTDEAMRTYLASVKTFRQATSAGGVDVWLQNHPLMVPFEQWLTQTRARGPRDPNPFVVGRADYQRFVDVMEGCSDVALARRAQPR